jgi:hypothetical protein
MTDALVSAIIAVLFIYKGIRARRRGKILLTYRLSSKVYVFIVRESFQERPPVRREDG